MSLAGPFHMQEETEIESEEVKACRKIYQELVSTEKEYIEDLHHVVSVSDRRSLTGGPLIEGFPLSTLCHTITLLHVCIAP